MRRLVTFVLLSTIPFQACATVSGPPGVSSPGVPFQPRPELGALAAAKTVEDYVQALDARITLWQETVTRATEDCERAASGCAPRWIMVAPLDEQRRWEQLLLPRFEALFDKFTGELRSRGMLGPIETGWVSFYRRVAEAYETDGIGEEEFKRRMDILAAYMGQYVQRDLRRIAAAAPTSQWNQPVSVTTPGSSGTATSSTAAPQSQISATDILATFLGLLFVGLSIYNAAESARAYRSTLRRMEQTPTVVPSAPPVVTSPVPTVTGPCTYRLNALQGRMVCVRSDGVLVTQ